MDVTPQDRDLIIRTVIGEAGNQPPEGQAGVASVILNRVNSGGYGDGVQGVVTKPKQFEPWETRRNELLGYSPESRIYQNVGKVVDDVITGKIKDPTNGATHFADVDTVKARGNNTAMGWINGMSNVSKIGAHTFGNADAGRDKMAQADDYSDLISEFGKAPAKETATTDAPKSEDYSDLIKEFGSTPKASTVQAAQPQAQPVASNVPTPEKFEAGVKQYGVNNSQPAGIAKDIGTIAEGVKNLPAATFNDMGQNAQTAQRTISEAVNEIGKGNTAAGAGKVGLGVLSGVFGIPGAVVDNAVTKPVTQLTGNPAPFKELNIFGNETGNTINSAGPGERAGMVAGGAIPFNKLGKAVQSAVPNSAAIKTIVDAIGQKDLPEVINKLKANPRLAVYDVSPNVQQMSQKLVVTPGDHQSKFVQAVEQRAGTAKGAVTSAVDDALGAPVNVLEKVNTMKQAARDTGSKIINPVVERAKPADITSVVNNLDNAIASNGPVERKTLEALKNGEAPPLPLSDAQSKLFQIREQLRGDWKDRDEMFLDVGGEQGAHKVQSTLRREAQNLIDSPNPQDRSLGHKIMGVRNQLVDAIDKSSPVVPDTHGVPKIKDEAHANSLIAKADNDDDLLRIRNKMDEQGMDTDIPQFEDLKGKKLDTVPYKQALGKYADDMHVQEGFDKGTEIIKNRPTVLEDRPEYWEHWVKQNVEKPQVLEAAREGARIAVDQQLRGMKNAVRQGTAIPDIDFNVDKMKLLFKPKEVDKMIQKLRDERSMADSNQKLVGNSQTAMRLKNDARVDVPEHTPFGAGGSLMTSGLAEAANAFAGGIPGAPTAALIAAKTGKYAFDKGRIALAKGRNSAMTDLLTATGPKRDALINQLEKYVQKPQLSIGQKVGLALGTSKP